MWSFRRCHSYSPSSAVIVLVVIVLHNDLLEVGAFLRFPFYNFVQNAINTAQKVVSNVLNIAHQTASNLGILPPAGYIYADTTVGRLKGTKATSRLGRTFYRFKGIPYARPPVGYLRFEPPVPHDGWSGVRDATKFKSQCWQQNVVTKVEMGNEDCLFLNVFTRFAYTKDKLPRAYERLHPVIVFIPGGLFMNGGSNMYRPKYFLDEDVVLVTINYRLTSFGFLNTGDGLIAGNMGLKDQTMALRWIQRNIRYFHGDPNRVTLLGESAGAVSVHLHTLSPMSQGLFSGAISQSGTALSPWGLIENPAAQAREFANGVGCRTGNSRQMVECLKRVPARTIARYHVGFIEQLAQDKNSLFGPTVEIPHDNPSFLPARPLQLMKQGNISRSPWISGVNSGDGLVYLIFILRSNKLLRTLNSRWNHFAPTLLAYQNHTNRDALSSEVKKFYLNNAPISQSNIVEAANMISDRSFFLDSHDSAILQSRVAPTYVYYYTYQGLFSIGDLLFSGTPLPLPPTIDNLVATGINWWTTNVLGIRPKHKLGIIAHGDELALLFNLPFVRKEINEMDVDFDFSRKLVKLWVSFAENGIPNPQRAGESVRWDIVQKHDSDLRDVPLKRLNLDQTFSIAQEPFYRRMQFWKRHSLSYL